MNAYRVAGLVLLASPFLAIAAVVMVWAGPLAVLAVFGITAFIAAAIIGGAWLMERGGL